jgi:hypothetical protein
MNRTRQNFDSKRVGDVAHVSQPVAPHGILANAKLTRNLPEGCLAGKRCLDLGSPCVKTNSALRFHRATFRLT